MFNFYICHTKSGRFSFQLRLIISVTWSPDWVMAEWAREALEFTRGSVKYMEVFEMYEEKLMQCLSLKLGQLGFRSHAGREGKAWCQRKLSLNPIFLFQCFYEKHSSRFVIKATNEGGQCCQSSGLARE